MRARSSQPDAEELILGTGFIAKATGFNRGTVIRAIQAGQLRAFRTKPNGGHYRIKQRWYEDWRTTLEVTVDGS